MLNLGAFLSYVFVVTFTPGPNNIMAMANASKFGFKNTLKFIFGISTGFFMVLILSSYFNLLLFSIMPKVKLFMGILGAGYMIYLATKIMKSKEKVDEENNEEMIEKSKTHELNEENNKLNSFYTGLIIQFVNPKGIIFGITVVSNFIIPYYKSNIALILFSILLAFIGFTSIICWALFGSLFNKFLSKYRRQFNIIMGLLLIYSALSISGITQFFNK